jgi:large repetitive protein
VWRARYPSAKLRLMVGALRALSGGWAAATIVIGLAGAAQPSTEPDGGTTGAAVEVTSAITLTGLGGEFFLTGMPGATVSDRAAVRMNVETNNVAGYLVTVQSGTPTMLPATTGNTDTVPIGSLSVRGSGTDFLTPLSATDPVTVHSKPDPSAAGGDDLSDDYQVVIPFVSDDFYTATLDYVATTL